MASVNIPPLVGDSPEALKRWARDVAGILNNAIRDIQQFAGAFYVWNRGCLNVPQNTTISGAEEIVFDSPYVGNGSLILAIVGASGGVNVALNGTNLGTLSDADTTNEILYEVSVDNLVEGLNSFKIWDTATDGAELRRIEAWRNFSKEQITSAGTTADWGSVTGPGKPEDDATVGAPPGTPVGNAGDSVDVENNAAAGRSADDDLDAMETNAYVNRTTGAVVDADHAFLADDALSADDALAVGGTPEANINDSHTRTQAGLDGSGNFQGPGINTPRVVGATNLGFHSSDNELLNGSFLIDSADFNTSSDPNTYTDSGDAAWARQTTTPRSTANAALVYSSGGSMSGDATLLFNGNIDNFVECRESRPVMFEVWVRRTFAITTGTFALRLRWTNSAGGQISTTDATFNNSGLTQTYQVFRVYGVAPAGTVKVSPQLRIGETTNASGNTWQWRVDDARCVVQRGTNDIEDGATSESQQNSDGPSGSTPSDLAITHESIGEPVALTGRASFIGFADSGGDATVTLKLKRSSTTLGATVTITVTPSNLGIGSHPWEYSLPETLIERTDTLATSGSRTYNLETSINKTMTGSATWTRSIRSLEMKR